MVGEVFNKTTLLQKLRFNGPTIKSQAEAIISADANDVSYSAQKNGGVARIKLSHTYPDPLGIASNPTSNQSNSATDESARAFLLALVNAYVLIRSFRQTRDGDGLVTIVKAYHADVSNTSLITQAQLDPYIRIPETPAYIGDTTLFFSSSDPWNQMINAFSTREDLSYTYCHGNFPPPCHGSRGRR